MKHINQGRPALVLLFAAVLLVSLSGWGSPAYADPYLTLDMPEQASYNPRQVYVGQPFQFKVIADGEDAEAGKPLQVSTAQSPTDPDLADLIGDLAEDRTYTTPALSYQYAGFKTPSAFMANPTPGHIHFYGSCDYTLTVLPANTSLSLSADPACPSPGAAATLTATLSVAPPGGGTPEGTLEFFDGAVSLGTVSVSGVNDYSLPTTTLSAGRHSFRAVFTPALQPSTLLFNHTSSSASLALSVGASVPSALPRTGDDFPRNWLLALLALFTLGLAFSLRRLGKG